MYKLLQICVEGNTGSTGRLAEAIGKMVISKGWNSFIAHGRYPRPSESNIIKIGNLFDIIIHGIITRLLDFHGLGSRRATKKLLKKVTIIKPDLIVLHHLHGYYINIEILSNYLSKSNIPVIWIFHDCWSITGHCAHFDYVGCNRWQTGCHSCPQTKKYPGSFLVDRSRANYKLKKRLFNNITNLTIVSVSSWLDSIVAKSFLANKARVVIHNGVNVDLFKPRNVSIELVNRLNIKDKFIILGIASPWTKRKGFNDFISLSKIIPNDVVIILIGVTDKQIKKLPENIIGIKKTESQLELSEYYNLADLFINFSVEETFGLTTAEALSCGVPALVYDTTGCPEVVDNSTGFVIKKGDYEAVLAVIKNVRQNGRYYYQEDCRSRVLSLFNEQKMLDNYYILIKSKLINSFLPAN